MKASPGATAPARRSTAPQRAGIQSLEVGFALLEVLSTSPGALMLRDLAAAASMSAAKAHRYLVSFQRLGMVVQDPATTLYDLGPAALKLGLASLSRLDSVKLARQRLQPLMAQTGQTLALAVWGNQGPTLVHWEESPRAVTVNLRLGDVMPLLSSATGLCFTAFSSPRLLATGRPQGRLALLVKDELARNQKLARQDVPTTMAGLAEVLEEVRRRGMARAVNTLLPGVAGFCAPVFDADGHLALGMVALGSLATFDAEWDGAVARPLAAAARQLSRDLGFEAA
ncbi:IclR family transcriptional regulator [Polaromonas sp. JS666]|uniref:IclR family transcriptional regulator n=1 Tax=Polaromonas sp. (strain JS666 / ATCC BAA-500) TaxID=296591 RepID=UPI00087E6053|nr:IclR family transcriptional regulator [Polaromonas sp. JS666]SDN85512.1 DNA-binding transcriptional regulator, IclR family [Polaromonas sp. JS666]